MRKIFILTDFRPTCLSSSKTAGKSEDEPREEFEIKSLSPARRLVVPAYTGRKVCAVIKCFRCQKIRCVYSNKPLSSKLKTLLFESIEKRTFSCGSSLFEPGHPLDHKIYTKGLSCSDKIERAFYCSHLASQNICHDCGGQISKEDVNVRSNRLGLELPYCISCKDMKKIIQFKN